MRNREDGCLNCSICENMISKVHINFDRKVDFFRIHVDESLYDFLQDLYITNIESKFIKQ